jgi:hypothetical protein
METCEQANESLININTEKTGNEKRKESCKNVGAEKKNKGHKREKDFLKKYNPDELDNPTEYGATSDTSICQTHSICNELYEKINPSNLNVSNKSGNNIQLTLGNIPELNNPANANSRINSYPNAYYTGDLAGPDPSIRGRNLYIPLNNWFGLKSQMAFPLTSLQYNELHINVTFKPINQLFVIRDVFDATYNYPYLQTIKI